MPHPTPAEVQAASDALMDARRASHEAHLLILKAIRKVEQCLPVMAAHGMLRMEAAPGMGMLHQAAGVYYGVMAGHWELSKCLSRHDVELPGVIVPAGGGGGGSR